jgi:flagellar biosynthesis/type III secretory pathway protein FliH
MQYVRSQSTVGYAKGKRQGYMEGYEEGDEDGYKEGYLEGYTAGAVVGFMVTCVIWGVSCTRPKAYSIHLYEDVSRIH